MVKSVIEKVSQKAYLQGKADSKKSNKKKKVISKKLKKGNIKLPIRKLSAQKLLSQIAQQQGALVSPYDLRQQQFENPTQDNRSLFFNEAWINSKNKQLGGFL